MMSFSSKSGKPKRHLSPEEVWFMCSVTSQFVEGNWLRMAFKDNVSQRMCPVNVRNNFFSDMVCIINRHSNQHTHSYFCPHAFSAGNRTEEYLYALHSIVIDIDCHSDRYSKHLRDRKLQLLDYLIVHDAGDYGLPTPNFIVNTGRGLQIWWRHEPMSARSQSSKDTWLNIVRCFIEILRRMIADHSADGLDDMESLAGFEVDERTSLNPVGLFRIPGTYNPNAKEYSFLHKVLETETVYSCKEMCRFRDEYRAEHPPVSRGSNGGKRYQSGDGWNPADWAERTAGKIEKLRDLRDADIGRETRNNFCLGIYCLHRAARLNDKEAMERLHMFNSGFKKPMSGKELKSTLTSAHRKQYKYSTKALIKLLDISKKEAEQIELKYVSGNKNHTKKDRADIQERNKKIIDLYLTTEMTQKEVGNATGVCRKTVCEILKKAGIKRARQKAEQIQILHEKGCSVKQIGQEVSRSDRSVYRVLENAAVEIAGSEPEDE